MLSATFSTSDIKAADKLCNYFMSVFKPETGNKLPDLNTGAFQEEQGRYKTINNYSPDKYSLHQT